MFSAIKLQVSSSASAPSSLPLQRKSLNSSRSSDLLHLPTCNNLCCFASLSLQSDGAADASHPCVLTSSIASPHQLAALLPQWSLTHRHVLMLNAIAFAAAVSASWLFFSAIPTLLAFRKASESLEKLLDVTREELPDTMAAIRLSGMEISDLTMELSDLGQEITRGVRSSTQAVRVAEERLRRLTTMIPVALTQQQASPNIEPEGPVLAKAARGAREGIVKGREILQIFFSLFRFSRLALSFFSAQGRKP